MTSSDRTLVVGATGQLGMQIVDRLKSVGCPVRAMLRETADAFCRDWVLGRSNDVVPGDLKDPTTLGAACRGVRTVISTASSTLSRQPGDTIPSVDEDGQLALVEAAEREHVEHFVFVSFLPIEADFALQRAKRRVEERLRSSRMSHTILQPVNFSEVWLSPLLGFDPAHGSARVLGDGTRPVSWVSIVDVARFAVAARAGGAWANRVLPIGGPDPLSPLQVLAIYRELGVRDVRVTHVPEADLEAQLENAPDPVQEAFAGIMLGTARGQVVDPRPMLQLLPGRLSTVREHATRTVQNAQNEP